MYGGNVWGFEPSVTDPGFAYDVANGLLPKYSFIEPCYTDQFGSSPNSNHPGGAGIDWDDPNGQSLPPPIDVRDGEALLYKVYETLSQYPEVFDKTLLIVTYDEHGGTTTTFRLRRRRCLRLRSRHSKNRWRISTTIDTACVYRPSSSILA